MQHGQCSTCLIQMINENTTKYKITNVKTETVLSDAMTQRQKTTTHKVPTEYGSLNMVPNQRQRQTAASN